jgi:hypothetical protein
MLITSSDRGFSWMESLGSRKAMIAMCREIFLINMGKHGYMNGCSLLLKAES